MAISVEASCSLLQKPVKMLPWNVIELAQIALSLISEILDAVDVFALVAS